MGCVCVERVKVGKGHGGRLGMDDPSLFFHYWCMLCDDARPMTMMIFPPSPISSPCIRRCSATAPRRDTARAAGQSTPHSTGCGNIPKCCRTPSRAWGPAWTTRSSSFLSSVFFFILLRQEKKWGKARSRLGADPRATPPDGLRELQRASVDVSLCLGHALCAVLVPPPQHAIHSRVVICVGVSLFLRVL